MQVIYGRIWPIKQQWDHPVLIFHCARARVCVSVCALLYTTRLQHYSEGIIFSTSCAYACVCVSVFMSHLAVQCDSFREKRNLMTQECHEWLRGLKMGKYALIPGDHSHNISLLALLRCVLSPVPLICSRTHSSVWGGRVTQLVTNRHTWTNGVLTQWRPSVCNTVDNNTMPKPAGFSTHNASIWPQLRSPRQSAFRVLFCFGLLRRNSCCTSASAAQRFPLGPVVLKLPSN